MTFTLQQRRDISQQEFRKALAAITPNCPGGYSGQQIAAAKRIARQRTLALVA